MTSTDGWIEPACLVSLIVPSMEFSCWLFPQMTEPDFAVTFNNEIDKKKMWFSFTAVSKMIV